MTHLWVPTLDYGDKGYGYKNCKVLDRKESRYNADSYGLYVQEVFQENLKY